MATKDGKTTIVSADDEKIQRTLKEVLTARGLVVVGFDNDGPLLTNQSAVLWRMIAEPDPQSPPLSPEDATRTARVPTMAVYIQDTIRLTKDERVLDYVRLIDPEKAYSNIILIAPGYSMRGKSRSIMTEGTHIQLIPHEHLLFNALNHILVPNHMPLTLQQIHSRCAHTDPVLVQTFVEALPCIGVNDPINVLLGGVPSTPELKLGTVYEIRRRDCIQSLTCRRVVADYGL